MLLAAHQVTGFPAPSGVDWIASWASISTFCTTFRTLLVPMVMAAPRFSMRDGIRMGAWAILVTSLLASSQTSSARDTFLDLTVNSAMQSPAAANVHKDVWFYMQGQDHASVAQNLGEFSSNRRTNSSGKNDEDACAIAFLSAIITLQERAQSLGGNAVIDIKSIAKHNDLVSATSYRCVIGASFANVALSGTVVVLE
jgi:uncharacterized protein YbjQ (UPF0145 family)